MHDDLAARVAKLERANRRSLVALALFVLGASLFAAASMRRQTVLDARSVIVRDASGDRRAELTAGATGATLVLLDRDGSERVRIEAPDGEATLLRLATSRAERSSELRIAPDGWATLAFSDGGKQERLIVGLGYDGEPRVRLNTRDGKSRASLASDMSGRVEMMLHDASGTERAALRLSPDGTPSFQLYDSEGNARSHAP